MLGALGALNLKPLITPLLLPPASLLMLMGVGFWLRATRRPLWGAAVLTLAMVSLWFAHCRVTGDWIERRWLGAPSAIKPDDLPALRRDLRGGRAAVVVLGGGRDAYAPEYGEGNLTGRTLQRLQYGLWLSRRLDLPVLFSGGVGRAERGELTEAAVAARVAERDFGRPIRWLDSAAIDTRGNARHSLPLLTAHGIGQVLLVSHAWHLPRAQRAFQEAISLSGANLQIIPAPMDTATSSQLRLLDWLPSAEGYQKVRDSLREVLGLLAGA